MNGERRPRATDATALRPPGEPYDAAADGPVSYRWLWITVSVLLLLALAVIFVLPAAIAPVSETAALAPAPETAPMPDGDSEAQRSSAHRTLQSYLQLRARLELDNAPAWGEPDWSEASLRASAADRYFAQRQFAAATRDYQSALERLQRLAANRSVMLASALEEGTLALAKDDVDTAIARYETALMIEPDHPAATTGVAKAHSRSASIEQMNLGRTAETSGDLESARSAYLRATQLDGDHAAAQAALQRVAAQIIARDFTAAMNRAFGALDTGQTADAERALAEAEQLRPGDPAVRDARQRLNEIRTRAVLASLRRQAVDRIHGEDWQAAARLYRKALAIDPATGFALTGLPHAEQRVKLHAQLDHYLDEPARVYSAVPMKNAKRLLDSASDAPADEPRLAKKISALRELVTLAGTPMTLTLHSDGATSVVIYRIGHLGQFDTHQLDLLPGDYTIVGSRPGYRDVRKVIALRPDVSLPPLVVRCEEAI